MKIKILSGFAFLALCSSLAFAQQKDQQKRPKLAIGIVVDQMRWDYLYRYENKFGKDGFKRMLNQGYSLNNVHIDYVPTVTALGHTSIYTGSVPSIHGIAGNDWFDRETNKNVYCTTDTAVLPVGTSNTKIGSHSPKNLWSTTITDQLRIATNFRGKVVGVSLKDRASILPAGHNPTGAYWFDDTTGNFVTSSYYMDKLPEWVERFNGQNMAKKLVANGWKTLLPIEQYVESSPDNSSWEGLLGSAKTPTFPYNQLAADYEKNNGIVRYTPFGTTLTLEMAKAAVEGETLGKDQNTDFLVINIASTDYAGHLFGPNAIEVEDVYLRLDQELAEFFRYLDKKVGQDQYTVFLSADHGGAHAIGYLEEHKMPGGFFGEGAEKKYNQVLSEKFGADQLVATVDNYQVYLNQKVLKEKDLDQEEVTEYLVKYLNQDPTMLYAVDLKEVSEASIPEPIKSRIINGYNWSRSGDIQLVSRDNLLPSYAKKGTTHSVWNSYDSHIPLIFMGWGIKKGESNSAYHMTDIAPTMSALLKIEFPSGNIGNPIEEVLQK